MNISMKTTSCEIVSKFDILIAIIMAQGQHPVVMSGAVQTTLRTTVSVCLQAQEDDMHSALSSILVTVITAKKLSTV